MNKAKEKFRKILRSKILGWAIANAVKYAKLNTEVRWYSMMYRKKRKY